MAYLVDERDPRRAFELAHAQVLGRDPGCEHVLSDPRVSRRHARVARTSSGGYRIEDLGSRAGVLVDGRPVDAARLREGSVVQLGNTRLRLCLRRAPAPEVPPTPPPLSDCVACAQASSLRDSASAAPRTAISALRAEDTGFMPIDRVEGLDRLRRDYERLRAAYEVTVAVGTEQRPEHIARHILDAAFSILPAERGVVEVFAPGTTEPVVRAQKLRDMEADEQVRLSRTVVAYVVGTKAGLVSTDAMNDEDLRSSRSIHTDGLRSLMCVPLVHEDVVHGVMQLDCPHLTHAFQDEDLALFTTVAASAALALANVVLRGTLADRREAERLHLVHVLRDLPVGVALVDAEGRVGLANPAAARVFDALGRYDGERMTHIGPHAVEALAQRGLDRGLDVELDRSIYEIFARPSDPETHEVVLVLQDVTRRREQEERSSRADRLAVVGQIASGVAHDFNNLLTVIDGGASYLLGATSDPEVLEEAAAIREAGRRASRLVRQLLTFSRRDPVEQVALDLEESLRGMAELLARGLGKRHRLALEFGGGLPLVLMDRSHLEQLAMNLAVNASDAMEAPGVLTIRTWAEQVPRPAAVLEFADTGQGMDAATLEQAFEPFFTTKPVGQGTGLGLATLHGIVEGAGGDVRVFSELGVGTRFVVRLPAHTPSALEATVDTPMEAE